VAIKIVKKKNTHLSSIKKEDIERFLKKEKVPAKDVEGLKWLIRNDDRYNKIVVGPEEFFTNRDLGNALNPDGSCVIYPKVMPHLVELNTGNYDEALLTGSIGSAKTTLALNTIEYQLYLVSCYSNPHTLFNLDPASEILFVFQSLNATTAESVDYARFKAMIDRSPYFKKHFPYDKSIKSELRFPNRVIVKPTASNIGGAIGQNLIAGLIDEINFMSIVEKSKKSMDGAYDQAKELYDAIDRRRKSRFMYKGKLPGILCLSSSKRYPGEFTDIKMAEARKEIAETGHSTIFVYDKRSWDIRPDDAYSGVKFRVFVGDESRRPRILEDDEEMPDKDLPLITEVPEEYKSSFEQDIIGSIRDIAGISTTARFPYMIEVEKVSACFGKTKSILTLDEVDFNTKKVSFNPKTFFKPDIPRFIHIDLGITSDAAGVACGYVPEFVTIKRGAKMVETLPKIVFDFVLRVVPPKNGEILFFKIRELIYKLKEHGLNIRWVSYDMFQSVDSMQMLRQKGFATGYTSMDRTSVPYDFTKGAFYDGRVLVQDCDHPLPGQTTAKREILALERDPKTGKVDHPPTGSKDLADAMAGVIYGLTVRREVWAWHSISVADIPESILSAVKKQEGAMKEGVPEGQQSPDMVDA
jgi:hypothetical protein